MHTNNKQQHCQARISYQYLLKMTTLKNDTMEFPDTESLLRLLLIEKNLSPELRGAINDNAKNLLNDLTEDVREFLHHDLHEEKHNEDDIRTIVQCIPTALSDKHEFSVEHKFLVEDDNGVIPILVFIHPCACGRRDLAQCWRR